jgi:cysteine desulfurase
MRGLGGVGTRYRRSVADQSRFFDAASAAPLHPAAREALLAALGDGWADPRRLYGAGRRARLLLDAARESVAESLGARADEVSFAPSGIVALQAGVLGTLRANRRAGTGFVHSAVEHSAVLEAARTHEAEGGSVVSVGVDGRGRVDVGRFAAAATAPGVAAAALQAANQEVGTRQPVDVVAEALDGRPLIVDATHAVGRIELPTGWSVLTADARTWGGGPGVGVLAVRTGTRWSSPYPADDSADPRLPGPPDLPAVVAAAAALRAVTAERDAEAARLWALTERIRATVAASVPDVEVLGAPEDRLPHLVAFSCLYVDGETLLSALDRLGFAVSSGSSCTSSALEPSHVLVAMGALSSGNVRISLHRQTTELEVDDFLAALPAVVAGIRAELGASDL